MTGMGAVVTASDCNTSDGSLTSTVLSCDVKGVYNIARGGILGVDYLPDTGHFSNGDNELLQSSLLCSVVVYVAQPTMAAVKFFIVVAALLLCASLGAGYNCTRRYQRLLREAATVKAQCPNAAFHDCCQVG